MAEGPEKQGRRVGLRVWSWARPLVAIAAIGLAAFGGWVAGAMLERREAQERVERLMNTLSRERAQAEVPREVELECGEVAYREVAAAFGPGRFLLSCAGLEQKGNKLIATLEVGNPFRVEYQSLGVVGALAREGTRASEHEANPWYEVFRGLVFDRPRANSTVSKGALAPGGWMELEVPIVTRTSGSGETTIARGRKIIVEIWPEEAPLARPSVDAAE